MLARLSLSVLVLVAGCGGSSVEPYLVGLVTPSGASPLAADGGVTHVTLVLQQGTTAPVTIDEDVTSGSYMHDLAFSDFSSRVALRATLTTPAGPLVGAPPDFLPGEAPVRVPVGPPSTCAVIAGATLAAARARPAASSIGTFSVVAGSEGALEFFDGLTLAVQPDTGDALPDGFGDVGLVTLLPGSAVLAVSRTTDAAARFTTSSSDATMRTRLLAVPHPGAHAGALLSLGSDGAVVLGGENAGVAVDGVTFVGTDGALDATSTHLVVARDAPAAARLSSGVVLVAGGAPGAAAGEGLGGRGATSLPATGVTDVDRRGGALFLDALRVHAVLVGGVDASGAPVASTVLFDCTASPCVATAGPVLADARAGATQVALDGGGLLVGGLAPGPVDHVTRVRVGSDGTATFDTLHLAVPRASPAVYALASGLVYVVAGVGADGARTDVEVCFPDALTPL